MHSNLSSKTLHALKNRMSLQLPVFWPIMIVVIISVLDCTTNAELDEPVNPAALPEQSSVYALTLGNALPSTVTFNRVELYLYRSANATGDLTLQIRNAAGTAILDSIRMPVSSISAGISWKMFEFPKLPLLERGKRYRLYVKRSDNHNPDEADIIWWGTNLSGDVYSSGSNDLYPSRITDYAFRTYSNDGIDQEQLQTGRGYFVGNDSYRWQEFIPDYPVVKLTSIDLNLSIANGATGKLYVEIQADTGPIQVSQEASSLPVGQSWVSISWNGFIKLYRDKVYRIYVYRSDTHSMLTNNYIFWMCSDGINAYPDGINDTYPVWDLDYGFKTHSTIGGLDQQQTLTDYGFAVSNDVKRWQEFVPRHQ